TTLFRSSASVSSGMLCSRRSWLPSLAALCLVFAACSEEDRTIVYPEAGPAAGEAGRGTFTFGAATAAAQIEEDNVDSDWWWWTLPVADGGLGESVPVGDAVMGHARAIDDVALLAEMNLDAYRFSVNWARIEPTRDAIVEA